MRLPVKGHLTYCSNIHPGESWEEVWWSIQSHLPVVKQNVSPHQPMGIGLRLSNQASIDLEKSGISHLMEWMEAKGFYVFTMNGFPFGGFHGQRVKDEVHKPDWTSDARVDYTKRLFDLLAKMLPPGIDGGISTSPLSYKLWWSKDQQQRVLKAATDNLLKIVLQLRKHYEESGKLLHLDIEPEPDGLIENSKETVDYFNQWLIPIGTKQLSKTLGITSQEAETIIRRHITICYDVCHFAVAYESPTEVIQLFKQQGITIGKIQISSALKGDFTNQQHSRANYANAFESLNEPTYLHQVVARDKSLSLRQYPDLEVALNHIEDVSVEQWRTHFHVPVFLESYGLLQSTQQDILEVLKLWNNNPITNHLEVETYTWEVLPKEMQSEINTSIARELNWVTEQISVL